MNEAVRHLVMEACGLLEACGRAVDEDVLRRVAMLRVELGEALEECGDEELFEDGRAVVCAMAAVLEQEPVEALQRLAS